MCGCRDAAKKTTDDVRTAETLVYYQGNKRKK